jgi:hypothetical protein
MWSDPSTIFASLPLRSVSSHQTKNLIVDLDSLLKLSFRQVSLAHGIEAKLPFPIGKPALAMGMIDRLGVQRTFIVLGDAG